MTLPAPVIPPRVGSGTVYLVGAGPGDPSLLTLRAHDLLQTADTIAHDELVSSAILALVPTTTERLCVGRRHGDGAPRPVMAPAILERARAGRAVVRLKGGDPFIFGRGAEEIEALNRAGIRYEVVPGISAALGAAAYAGIPLTDRRLASRVTFSTGRRGEDALHPSESSVSQDATATSPGETLVLYMGGRRLKELATQLIAGGRPPSMPAAFIEAATLPEQHVVVGTLADLAERVADRPVAGPALVIVGEVVRLREQIVFTESRPLVGRTILVARARPEPSRLVAELSRLGATVFEQPSLQVTPPASYEALDAALANPERFSGIAFACRTGAEMALKRLSVMGRQGSALGQVPVIALGSAVGQTLRRHGVVVLIESEGTRRDGLARWAPLFDRRRQSRPLLVVSGEEKRSRLLADLLSLDVGVSTLPAYGLKRTFTQSQPPDLVVVPSSAAADCVLSGPLAALLQGVPVLAMGQETERAARQTGVREVTRPPHDTIPALVEAAVRFFGGKSDGARDSRLRPPMRELDPNDQKTPCGTA
jgi:uroporphyrinogen III methyltransferase/synthase